MKTYRTMLATRTLYTRTIAWIIVLLLTRLLHGHNQLIAAHIFGSDLDEEAVNRLSSTRASVSQIILNPIHETVSQADGSVASVMAGEEELIYAAMDPFYVESYVSFDLSYASLDDAEFEDALSNATLKLYWLSGDLNSVSVDLVDRESDYLKRYAIPEVDYSSCAGVGHCWVEVDLTAAVSWSVEQSLQISQRMPQAVSVRISTNQQMARGSFASSSYNGGVFSPTFILDFDDEQGSVDIDVMRTIRLKGSNRQSNKKKQKKKKKKKGKKKRPGKNKNPGKKKPNKKPGMNNGVKQQQNANQDKPKKGNLKKDKPSNNKPNGNSGQAKQSNLKPVNTKPSNVGSNPKPKPITPAKPSPRPIPQPAVPLPPSPAKSQTLKILDSKKSIITEQILQYEDPVQGKIESVYTYDGLAMGLAIMSTKGVAGKNLPGR
ncbi:hypothetical protein HJC23_006564 [Cyclotella cryptica]|uniref:Uncharacterized protein n=1 Tax=Cyclotella cryptica TaxID=29204 RepID=A0ABD3PMK8_9STRA|eukprot:CCRYP_013643-RE/>CCRYP_013643-RE protein AED:0.07 eAED:0.07 QI:261/1/1/1/0.77/0.7/10/1219/432